MYMYLNILMKPDICKYTYYLHTFTLRSCKCLEKWWGDRTSIRTEKHCSSLEARTMEELPGPQGAVLFNCFHCKPTTLQKSEGTWHFSRIFVQQASRTARSTASGASGSVATHIAPMVFILFEKQNNLEVQSPRCSATTCFRRGNGAPWGPKRKGSWLSHPPKLLCLHLPWRWGKGRSQSGIAHGGRSVLPNAHAQSPSSPNAPAGHTMPKSSLGL